MLLLHTCGCASPIHSGLPPSFSCATLAPSASARTEARSHRGYLHIFREQSAVLLDLIRCFPFNGLRHPPRATLLLPGRVRLQPPHYNSSRIARDLPVHHRPARCAAAPPLPAVEPVFARPCRVTPALAHARSRHLGRLLPQPSHSRVRANRASSALRARSAQHLHTPPASTALPRACSRQPPGVAHIRSCTASRVAHEFASHPHAASLLGTRASAPEPSRVHFLRDMRLHSPVRTRSLPCTSTPPAHASRSCCRARPSHITCSRSRSAPTSRLSRPRSAHCCAPALRRLRSSPTPARAWAACCLTWCRRRSGPRLRRGPHRRTACKLLRSGLSCCGRPPAKRPLGPSPPAAHLRAPQRRPPPARPPFGPRPPAARPAHCRRPASRLGPAEPPDRSLPCALVPAPGCCHRAPAAPPGPLASACRVLPE
jgi:hypothetical protein